MSDLAIRACTPDDWPAVSELGARTFSDGSEVGYQRSLIGWRRLPQSPDFDWTDVYIGVVDGQVVAHVRVVDAVLRLGQVALRFGGLSGVVTHPDYRGRGYAAALVRACIRAMEDAGQVLSLLDGIPRFYGQFGYASVWPNYTLSFTAGEAANVPDDGSGYVVRPGSEADLPALLALYNAQWPARPWFVERSLDALRFRLPPPLAGDQPYFVVVEDAAGSLRGYSTGYRADDRSEVLATDPAAVSALMRHAAAAYAEDPAHEIKWLVAPDEPAAYYAGRFCKVGYHRWYSPNGGWMARMIDAQATIDRVRPLLVAWWEALGAPGDLDVANCLEGVRLRLASNTLTVPQGRFLQLLFGFLTPREIDETLTDRDIELRDHLKRLFPPVTNQLAGLDWF